MSARGVRWTVLAFEIDRVDVDPSPSAGDRESAVAGLLRGSGDAAAVGVEPAAVALDPVEIDHHLELTPERREMDRPLRYLYARTGAMAVGETRAVLDVTVPYWDRAVVARAFRGEYIDATLYGRAVGTDDGDVDRAALEPDGWLRAAQAGRARAAPAAGYVGRADARGLDVVYRLADDHDVRLRAHVGGRDGQTPATPTDGPPASRLDPDDVGPGEVLPYWVTTHRGSRPVDPELFPERFVEGVTAVDGVADATAADVSPNYWLDG